MRLCVVYFGKKVLFGLFAETEEKNEKTRSLSR